MLAPLGFNPALVWFLLSMSPFLSFGIGMWNLYHCILGVCNLFFILQELTAKSALSLRADFGVEPLNNVGTIGTLGTFALWNEHEPFGAYEQNVVVWIRNVPHKLMCSTLSLSWWCYFGISGNFRGWNLVGGSRLLGVCLVPFPSLCFLSTKRWTASSSTPPLPHHKPRMNDSKGYGLKSLKLWAKIRLSSLKLFSHVLQWQSREN